MRKDSQSYTSSPEQEKMEDNVGIGEQDEEIKKQEQKAKNDALDLSNSVNDTMSRKSGRDFTWHLLTECGVFKDAFNENPIVLARNTGFRAAGLLLLNLILIECPDKYEQMFSEHKYKEGKE